MGLFDDILKGASANALCNYCKALIRDEGCSKSETIRRAADKFGKSPEEVEKIVRHYI